MTNFEFYKNEIYNIYESDELYNEMKSSNVATRFIEASMRVMCKYNDIKVPYHDMAVRWLAKEYNPNYLVSRTEYIILYWLKIYEKDFKDRLLKESLMYQALKKQGMFKNIKDDEIKIKDITERVYTLGKEK